MKDMVRNVYFSLKERTAGIQEKVAEYNKLAEMEKSGKYSGQYLNKSLLPQMRELKTAIERDKEAALNAANALVEDYQNKLRDLDNLHPEDITEDAKLFTSGIKLKAKDINAILARNQGNATMEQMAIRYAEENGVDLGRNVHYIGHQAQIREAGGVSSAVHYYGRWIDKPNAEVILNKFFQVSEE